MSLPMKMPMVRPMKMPMVKPLREDEKLGRRCVISGEVLGSHQLIRFIADADGFVFPDLGGKIKGSEAYVTADRLLLEKAVKTGQLARSLSARHVDEGMPEMVDKLLVKRCQDHISLGRRSGIAIGGGGKIRSLGEVAGLLIADDASQREARALRGDVEHDWIISVMGSHELGIPFGRRALAFVAVLHNPSYGATQQSEKLSEELRRLATYRHKRSKRSDGMP
jgi:predicted RNA-binding protein YlxR (DUF448 family)